VPENGVGVSGTLRFRKWLPGVPALGKCVDRQQCIAIVDRRFRIGSPN